MNNKVIVIGGEHHNTLGILRSLGKVGVRSYLLSEEKLPNFVSVSKYVRKAWFVNSERSLVEIICKNFANEDEKAVVFCCSDWAALIIDRNRMHFEKICLLPQVNERYTIASLMNKKFVGILAEKAGFRIPHSWIYKKNDEIPADMIYPNIIKPLESINGGKMIYISNDKNDLLENINKVDFKLCPKLLIEEYINSNDEVVILGCAIGSDFLIPCVIRKIRNIRGGTTFGIVENYSYYNTAIESVKNLQKELSYNGLFGVELLVSDGKFNFIEMNLRNDATSYACTKAGVNIAAYYYKKQIMPMLKSPLIDLKEIFFMAEFRDFSFVYHKSIPLYKWINDLFKTKCFMFFDKHDYNPFLYVIKQIIKNAIKKHNYKKNI